MKAERGNPISLGIALKCTEKLFLWILSFGFLAAEWHAASFSWSICLSFPWWSSSIARHDRFLLLILLVLALEQIFSLGKTFGFAKLSCRWCPWIPKHGLICSSFLDYSQAVYFHLSEPCCLSLPVHMCQHQTSLLAFPSLTAHWGSWASRVLFSMPTSWTHLSTGGWCHPAQGSPPWHMGLELLLQCSSSRTADSDLSSL